MFDNEQHTTDQHRHSVAGMCGQLLLTGVALAGAVGGLLFVIRSQPTTPRQQWPTAVAPAPRRVSATEPPRWQPPSSEPLNEKAAPILLVASQEDADQLGSLLACAAEVVTVSRRGQAHGLVVDDCRQTLDADEWESLRGAGILGEVWPLILVDSAESHGSANDAFPGARVIDLRAPLSGDPSANLR